MAVIPVLEWMPDAAALGNKGSVDVRNAVPGTNSYKPMPRYTALSGALDARARGAIDVRDKDLNVYQYAGDAAKLYVLSSTTWSDASLAGGYSTSTEEHWEFARWKNKVLATNWDENPQSLELGGANFGNMTTAFRCRRLAVVGDFVVAANTFDATDGNVPDRVRWSAFNDETDFTVSPTTGSDFRDLKRGPIQKVYGGEYGIILGRDAVFRMDFVGAPTWFQIRETVPEVGLIAPGASARIGNTIYMWSNQGMVAIVSASGDPVPIGAGKVDRYVFSDLDDSYLYRISAVADPRGGRVFWAYPGAGNVDGLPNRILCYDKNFNRWSIIDQDVELLWRAGGVGFTLEQLDSFSASIDELDASLDSSQWKGGGAVLLAGFNSAHQHGFFNGSAMTATIDTSEKSMNPGYKTMLTGFRPLVSGGTVTAQVGKRNRQQDEVTWGSVISLTDSGRFPCRANARFHRMRLSISGDWSDAIGVEVDTPDAKRVGRRG